MDATKTCLPTVSNNHPKNSINLHHIQPIVATITSSPVIISSPQHRQSLGKTEPSSSINQKSKEPSNNQQTIISFISTNNLSIKESLDQTTKKSKELKTSPNAAAIAKMAAAKSACGRRWKSKNGERLRDGQGYRLRAAGICARRNEEGELELLLVSAQRGPHAWVIPGGGIELGEQVHEAVLREVEEEAGVRAHVLELIGEFQDDDRLHRTALYLLSANELLDEWEDGRHGRKRKWLRASDALGAVKPSQRSMLERSARRIAEIESTAISAR